MVGWSPQISQDARFFTLMVRKFIVLASKVSRSVGEQFAYTEEVLQSLGCLNGSEHTGDGTQDACLATGRNSACWRWFLEEAAVTCRAWKWVKVCPWNLRMPPCEKALPRRTQASLMRNFTGKLSVPSMTKSHGLMISSALCESRKS